jgi:N-acetylmuramoyl-L-alanine amidase
MTPSNEVGRRARGSRARSAAALFALAVVVFATPLAALTERAKLPAGEAAALVDRKELYFEALPLRGEGLIAFCRRLTGSAADCARIAEVNGRPRRLLAGRRYRVPYPLLTTDRKLAVVRALFPGDRAEPAGWLHRSRGEPLAKTALWFTGSESNAQALAEANRLSATSVRVGMELRVPDALLLAIFRVSAPAPPPGSVPPRVPAEPVVPPSLPAPAPPPATAESPLQFGEDETGRFALYRLRGGEALYSAVVVRFTGRDHADDVNALAAEIAKRSGIADVTDISIGHPIKIPLDLLLPEHLPAGDPRRLEWEVEQRLAEQFRNPVKAKGLEGVTVILDAGHGGADVGASRADVWESLYVYDVVLRVRRALGERTRAQVLATTRDGAEFKLVERDKLPPSRGHTVLTTPPYPIGDATVGVHLRWYLANSLFRQHARNGASDRVVFVSIHADSLHPSLRGATVYIADASATVSGYGRSGPTFSSRKEYREQPRVTFSLRERQKSEGRSHDLAQKIIAGFREHTLAVHPFQPVRNRIFRGRRPWVPAVLRYNAVPAKMLLEICNLSNDEDRRLLQQSAFRETIAAAIVDGILRYFGESS